jgi:hypothetical protein
VKCPECSKKFKFKNVPFEDRVMNAFYTSFKCPKCRVLLKPDKRFQILSSLSLLIIALCVFGVLLQVWLNIGLSYEASGVLGLIGILLLYINSKNIRLLNSN